jgi:hypothetical protein
LSESGRGLWLAHQFGERVTVERLPRFGSHVSVTLPVWRASVANRKKAKEAARAQRSAAAT